MGCGRDSTEREAEAQTTPVLARRPPGELGAAEQPGDLWKRAGGRDVGGALAIPVAQPRARARIQQLADERRVAVATRDDERGVAEGVLGVHADAPGEQTLDDVGAAGIDREHQ